MNSSTTRRPSSPVTGGSRSSATASRNSASCSRVKWDHGVDGAEQLLLLAPPAGRAAPPRRARSTGRCTAPPGPGHPGDEHRAAVGLHAHRRAVLPVHVHVGVDARVHAVGQQQAAQRPAPEAQRGHRGVLHLDVGVVEVGRPAHQLLHLAHQPQQDVELVGRLVDQHPAALSLPRAAPGVALVVVPAAPAQDGRRAQHGPPDPAGSIASFTRRTEGYQRRWETVPSFTPAAAAGRDHPVAVRQAGGQRLLDEDVHAGAGGRHGGLRVVRVRGADRDRVHLAQHALQVVEGLHGRPAGRVPRPAGGEGARLLEAAAVHGGEPRAGQRGEDLRVDGGHLAQADDAGAQGTFHPSQYRRKD